ncbi:beta-1,3-glucan-binding protein [Diachasma alloeum]|uniref:beta-1,3-glucan-binding protein n=1 Tax=Diachasma alloeum TaxID=454923 RepID=UPI0007382949|nr:beta-1,3-glucan-binding protein [Diachasma alloeum]
MLIKFFEFSLVIFLLNRSHGFSISTLDELGVDYSRLQNVDSSITDDATPDELKHGHEIIRGKRCEKSVTVFNGKHAACQGDIIFEEEFNEKVTGDSPDGDALRQDNFNLLNSSLWSREVKIPQQPDYGFCVYHKLGKNIKIDNGVLRIVPTLLEDEFGENIVYFGSLQLADCDGLVQECYRNATSYNILPPIISARLTTKNTLNFRYGKIEVRAKFPKGDWLIPEMMIQGMNAGHKARITLGMARGNDNFQTSDDSRADFSSRLLEFEVKGAAPAKLTKLKNFGFWNDEFHVYRTIWTERGFTFEVDNERVGEIPHPHSEDNTDSPKDFYLTFGLGVGGMQAFPDNTRSGNYEKPWRNVEAKAMLRFWQAKDQWLPTWRLGTKHSAALEIDYVKISAV